MFVTTNTRILESFAQLIRYSGAGNVVIRNFDLVDYFYTMQSPDPSIQFLTQSACLPNDDEIQTVGYHNGLFSLTDSPYINYKSNLVTIQSTQPHYRKIVSNATELSIVDVENSPISMYINYGTMMDETYFSDSFYKNHYSGLMSVASILIHNTTTIRNIYFQQGTEMDFAMLYIG